MTPTELEAAHPELFAIARQMREQGGQVRIRCIHDADGNLIAGKRPEDMAPPGPVPDYAEPPPPAQPYRGRAR